MNPAHPEFETLMAGILDGDAGPVARERMAALLRTDPALRVEYVRQMRVDSLLAFAAGRAATPAVAKTNAPSAAGKIVRFPFAKATAAAAVLLLSGALYWSSRPAPDHPRRLAQELPSLLDAPPKSLLAEITLPDSEAASTDFLLPAYLNLHIP